MILIAICTVSSELDLFKEHWNHRMFRCTPKQQYRYPGTH